MKFKRQMVLRSRAVAMPIVFAGLSVLAEAQSTAPVQAGRSSAANSLPAAEAILDRYVEVTGGKAAYLTRKTEIMTGTIEFAAAGLKGKTIRYSAPPDQEYTITELDGIGTIETGIYMGAAWEKSVLLGPRIKNPEERDQAIREATFNAPLEWRKLYPKVETAGTAEINGEECYEVLLTPPSGSPEHQFYSKKSGLLVRTTMTAASQMGDIDVQVDVSDYKAFGGVLLPTRSRQKAGNQNLTITIMDVKVNEPIPAGRFEPPPDVSAAIRKAKASAEGRLP